MIILDKPYVSPLLEKTIVKNKIPVLVNDSTLQLELDHQMKKLDEKEFFAQFNEMTIPLLYTNSENAILAVYQHLQGTVLEEKTKILKNKALFREMTKSLYPDLSFREVKRDQLSHLSEETLSFPFIIKPSVGFFSMGVYKVDDEKDWKRVMNEIDKELSHVKGLYPQHVMGTEYFLIEDYIEGEEFAVDAYYDEKRQPVILNILKHLFSSDKDTSDRIYYTGKEVIATWYDLFYKELEKIGQIFDLRLYPVHIEFRVTGDGASDGQIYPIELNPLRFAGWCTTDMAIHAFSINPYEHFLFQQKPDWPSILEDKENTYYALTVADIPNTIDRSTIHHVDYERFLQLYDDVLELRKIDYHEYPVFAFVFSQVKQKEEMYRILTEDLSQYLVLNDI